MVFLAYLRQIVAFLANKKQVYLLSSKREDGATQVTVVPYAINH
jgi:hypothetical protein